MGLVLIFVLFLLVVGALPAWSYSKEWGYFPSAGMALVLFVIMTLMLLKRVPIW